VKRDQTLHKIRFNGPGGLRLYTSSTRFPVLANFNRGSPSWRNTWVKVAFAFFVILTYPAASYATPHLGDHEKCANNDNQSQLPREMLAREASRHYRSHAPAPPTVPFAGPRRILTTPLKFKRSILA
jgi:hypothetical protein